MLALFQRDARMCDLHRSVPVEPTGSWIEFGGKTDASDRASRGGPKLM
jgi:hypothetical protein